MHKSRWLLGLATLLSEDLKLLFCGASSETRNPASVLMGRISIVLFVSDRLGV